MHAHHIENFALAKEKRYLLANGATLCKACHKEFHRRYGQYRNNMTQLAEFVHYHEKAGA